MAKIKLTKIFLNCGRNAILAMPPAIRKIEAMRDAKMLIIPKALKKTLKGGGVFDSDIPDKLVSEEMAERYLEIKPPSFSLIPDYQLVINEIEQSYVIGNDFSAISTSCVVIERLLNQARISLHKHHKKDKKLWNKGSTNEWQPNIDALKKWSYLEDDFASELSDIYQDIRNRYLHCGDIQNMRQDALRTIKAAYGLITIFIGFPEDLFSLTGGKLMCKNKADPRFLEFYKPYMEEKQ